MPLASASSPHAPRESAGGSPAGAQVEGERDVLRGEREPELTLFVA
jgi:hypothetical protein